MSATPTTAPSLELDDPEELTVRLEQVGGKLTELASSSSGRRLAGPLKDCVQELRVVWSALRQFALVFDANRIEAMQEREGELRLAMGILNGTVASLSQAQEQAAARVDEDIHALDGLDAVDDTDLLVERLRAVSSDVRSVATEIRGDLSRSASELDQSEQIIREVDRKLDEAQKRIILDGLTRVLNRTGFEQRLAEMAGQPLAVAGSWCVVLVAVDHIEAVNEKHGRRVGDALLFRVAGLIQQICESYPAGIVGRTGGTEFGIILPRCPLREGRRMAEEIRGAVGLAKWECKVGSAPSIVSTTVSVGVTEYRNGESIQALLDRAEACYRQAERNGGNAVVGEG